MVVDDEWSPAVKLLEDVTKAIVRDDERQVKSHNRLDDGDCEVLYGRAGFLYALLLLRSTFRLPDCHPPPGLSSAVGSLVADASLEKVVQSIIRRGSIGATGHYSGKVSDHTLRPALMWTWHGEKYLGSAHGVGA
jgi:hypothetical protein